MVCNGVISSGPVSSPDFTMPLYLLNGAPITCAMVDFNTGEVVDWNGCRYKLSQSALNYYKEHCGNICYNNPLGLKVKTEVYKPLEASPIARAQTGSSGAPKSMEAKVISPKIVKFTPLQVLPIKHTSAGPIIKPMEARIISPYILDRVRTASKKPLYAVEEQSPANASKWWLIGVGAIIIIIIIMMVVS